MSGRLNQERESKLQPERMASTKSVLEQRGYTVVAVDHTELNIHMDDGVIIKFWPYSGWHSGKTITDGRGFKHLLDELEKVYGKA